MAKTKTPKCQTCKSKRILTFSGKCADLYRAKCLADDYEQGGFVRGPLNALCGDYVGGDLCLNCGQLQGTFPTLPDTDPA